MLHNAYMKEVSSTCYAKKIYIAINTKHSWILVNFCVEKELVLVCQCATDHHI